MTEFEEYKLLMLFHYNDKPLKSWLNESNYFNQFNKEWDHIMPVVEQIENIRDEDSFYIYNVHIEQYFVEILDNKTSDIIVKCGANTKLQSVYKACVKFIKYYNSK